MLFNPLRCPASPSADRHRRGDGSRFAPCAQCGQQTNEQPLMQQPSALQPSALQPSAVALRDSRSRSFFSTVYILLRVVLMIVFTQRPRKKRESVAGCSPHPSSPRTATGGGSSATIHSTACTLAYGRMRDTWLLGTTCICYRTVPVSSKSRPHPGRVLTIRSTATIW